MVIRITCFYDRNLLKKKKVALASWISNFEILC